MIKSYFSKMKGSKRTAIKRPFSEVIFAWIGSFLGIFCIWWFNHLIKLQDNESLYLIGSFGASAFLIYGAPSAEFSQPKNVIGGHLVSALAGVTSFYCLGFNIALAGAVAVASAVAGMLLTNMTHPPGGATALIAVISGQAIHDLGYFYCLSPVCVGAAIMVFVAIVVNNFSKNESRHYPKHWW